MGLLKGLLQARRPLLSVLAPLLLLPLPVLHPSSVSTRPRRGPGGGREGGTRLPLWVLFCWFEELEVSSWRRPRHCLPKSCHFRPSVSFPVPLPCVPAKSEVRGGDAELADMCVTQIRGPAFPGGRATCADEDTLVQ